MMVAVPIITWGDWDKSIRNDPYPLFESTRAECPVRQVRLADGHDAWLVLSHEAAHQALKDPRLSKNIVAALEEDPEVVDPGLPGPALARHMMNLDPPDHERLRRLVSRAFMPTRIVALQPSIERIAEELLDELERVEPDSVVDLVAGFAYPLPFWVICELLGVPEEDRAPLREAFRTLFQPWSGSPPPEAVAASDVIVTSLERLVATHRDHPRDDLVGVLVTASDDDDRLTEQELLSSLFQLIVAGHDTTTSLIGNGVVDLLENPDQWRILCQDASRLPAAIEELIRFSTPVPHATFRVTTETMKLADVEIPAREQVLICLGAANHDPDFYDNPAVLDISREPRPHLGFGHGIHFCLGTTLARLEAQIAFGALLGRFPDLELAVDRRELSWTHGDGLVLRGLAELPVRIGMPRRRAPSV
jgi:cytochrome P450